MIKTKKQMFALIGAFILTIMLGTVTYAFFNYTRTGSANVIKVGKISFDSSQNSTLSLTNVFPVSSSSVGNDYTQDTLKIAIEGDTTYDDGIEYLLTAEDVNVEMSTGKRVPLSLKIAVTDDLGTMDTDSDQIDYFSDRGSTTSYYKVLSDTILHDGQYLMVGYIAKGTTGVDGVVNVKAYLDEDKIAISDTYDGTESDTNGTTNSWVNVRTILTTNEWNSLQEQGHELSFKVRVEANEGIWVNPTNTVNSAKFISTDIRTGVTEVHFIRLSSQRMQERYDAASTKENLTDTTLNEGKVLAWQEGTKLYIASDGETYLPADSEGYLEGFTSTTKIEFENINTSRVTNMNSFFNANASLTYIDLSSFDMSNVQTLSSIFSGCINLRSINLSNKGNSSISSVSNMFNNCHNLKEINMSGFNFGTASMQALFGSLSNLRTVDLSNANTSNVTNINSLFNYCTNLTTVDLSGLDLSSVTLAPAVFYNASSLKTIYVSSTWDISGIPSTGGMFSGCTSLVGGNGTHFDASYPVDKTYARIDGLNNLPGYLTLKTN